MNSKIFFECCKLVVEVVCVFARKLGRFFGVCLLQELNLLRYVVRLGSWVLLLNCVGFLLRSNPNIFWRLFSIHRERLVVPSKCWRWGVMTYGCGRKLRWRTINGPRMNACKVTRSSQWGLCCFYWSYSLFWKRPLNCTLFFWSFIWGCSQFLS